MISTKIATQIDTAKLLVGFPITNYMVDLNDSTKLVQILPGAIWNIKDKQLGLVRGIYRDGHVDTASKGWGKCQLIKGDYYYFAIGVLRNGAALMAGDLLYTFIDMPGKYIGQLTKIAARYISLQKVTEDFFYNRSDVFLDWSKEREEAVLDSMIVDIHFAGKYFNENSLSMNKKITTGIYNNSMVFETMMVVGRKELSDFLDYIIARPNNYAGHDWKISEIFATWLMAGAPTVIRD